MSDLPQVADVSRRNETYWERASASRIDDYLLGGCNAYDRDRKVAESLCQVAPWLPVMKRSAQRHGSQAVSTLAQSLGITQFLDLGCGYAPGWGAGDVHDPPLPYESARAIHPGAKVVYVDADWVVITHAHSTLDQCAATTVVQAEVREVEPLLAGPVTQALDERAPVGFLLHDLLPWLTDEEATQLLTALRAWAPPGSAISLTHASFNVAPGGSMEELVATYAANDILFRPRSREQIAHLLGPWHIRDPGIALIEQRLGPRSPTPCPNVVRLRGDQAEEQVVTVPAYAAIATALSS
ncbi:SAM-dependent methyltransferase [Streptomyces buecherae]|uniref:SAM-dependent methyltransferase n=1 Tax=Streptomyces buecherae TaxID=2763006 RepID=UPI00367919B3